MRPYLMFLSIFLLLLPFHGNADAQSLRLSLAARSHDHYIGVERIDVEADRFMGLIFLTQCQTKEATKYLRYALEHDPKSQETLEALALVSTWPKEESVRIYWATRTYDPMNLSEYMRALICDPDNALARREFDRILAGRK